MRTRPLLVGNWKMNLGPAAAGRYARELRDRLSPTSEVEVWVAPPTVSLSEVVSALENTAIAVGAQNVHWADAGAFTGETSPLFLTSMGVRFALVGHSERRTYFGETDQQVALRTEGALKAGLEVIVCIGETEQQRAAGTTESVLKAQLEPVLACITPEYAPRVSIAYEPVWAIGTGKVATTAEIASAHLFIRNLWGRTHCAGSAGSASEPTVRILYGGSVTPHNFAEIAATPGVNGALVGGASIKLEQWLALIDVAQAQMQG